MNQGGQAKDYTSPRMVLSVSRLTQTVCRLRLSRRVSKADVDNALRLIAASKASVDRHGRPSGVRTYDDAHEVDSDTTTQIDVEMTIIDIPHRQHYYTQHDKFTYSPAAKSIRISQTNCKGYIKLEFCKPILKRNQVHISRIYCKPPPSRHDNRKFKTRPNLYSIVVSKTIL